MTREEIIKNLKYTMEKHKNDKVPTFGTNISVMCKDILDYLEQEPRWIPVSEKLPEYGEEVLTCSNGGFIEIQSLEDSYGGYWENQKGDWSDLDEIIKWMPLPKL